MLFHTCTLLTFKISLQKCCIHFNDIEGQILLFLNFKIHNVQFGLWTLKFIKMYYTFDDDENDVFVSM